MNHPYPISEGEDAIAQRAIEQRADWTRAKSGQFPSCGNCFARFFPMWPWPGRFLGGADWKGDERRSPFGNVRGRRP
jgi:hypothetical protein